MPRSCQYAPPPLPITIWTPDLRFTKITFLKVSINKLQNVFLNSPHQYSFGQSCMYFLLNSSALTYVTVQTSSVTTPLFYFNLQFPKVPSCAYTLSR